MSRELKFRAWVEDRFYPSDMYEDLGIFFSWMKERAEVIQQFSGIKDSEGREIYEGDIVRFGDNPIHEGTLVECQFSQSRAQWVYAFLTGQHKGKATDMVDTWRSYTVVGNIFENPELREETA